MNPASVCAPSDDEEVSLLTEAACPDVGNAANDTHAANAPDDDTLSAGLDMPDLPLDTPPDSFRPPASTAEASLPEEVPPAEDKEVEETLQEEQGGEEDNTVKEEPPSPQLCGHQEEGTLPGPPEESSGAGEEEEQREESLLQPEEEGAAPDELQPKTDSDSPEEATDRGAAPQEAPEEPGEMAPQEGTEEGQTSSLSCPCQSLLSNYNSNAPSRRKNRPCSLPVSELETVIASACGQPETPRSHYIRIHHLLHSLPSAKHRAPSQEEEEEETGEGDTRSITQDSTSTMIKTSKEEEEEQDDEEDEDTSQSPSQVQLSRKRGGEAGFLVVSTEPCLPAGARVSRPLLPALPAPQPLH